MQLEPHIARLWPLFRLERRDIASRSELRTWSISEVLDWHEILDQEADIELSLAEARQRQEEDARRGG